MSASTAKGKKLRDSEKRKLSEMEFAASNEWQLQTKDHSDACKSYSAVRATLRAWRILFSPMFMFLWMPIATFFIMNIDYVNKFPEKILVMAVFYMAGMLFCMRCIQAFHVSAECVKVIRSLGIQISTVYSSGQEVTIFYPSSFVHSIIINEGISMHQVFYYMAVVLKKDQVITKVHPIFMNSMPRLKLMRELYEDMNTVFGLPLINKTGQR